MIDQALSEVEEIKLRAAITELRNLVTALRDEIELLREERGLPPTVTRSPKALGVQVD